MYPNDRKRYTGRLFKINQLEPCRPKGRDQTNDSQPREEKASMIKICVESRAVGKKRPVSNKEASYTQGLSSPPATLSYWDMGGHGHRIELLMFAAAILASVHGKCLCYTEDVDIIFTKKNSSLFKLWNMDNESEMLCDS